MAPYQVLARKYRPQSFLEVLGQDPIVTTLKNAIKMGRIAHAYLFCGSRGTGKTTLARVFAKALNCQNPTPAGEPCNHCSSCKEIGSGNSLDVMEIDGASHRGIDDIRQINETVGYASSAGKYKIYIIDEVHMLTKEAFNALLKTLEEPPAKVLFIFATTEPHKVLPTILSRCQRFNLSRIPLEQIKSKLERIAKDMSIEIEKEAVHLLAQRAEGGLRDAESLFDQIIAFHEGKITTQVIHDVLGIMPKDSLFAIDQAGKEGRLSFAFEIAHQIFSEGKDVAQFVESMTEHFRTLLLVKMTGTDVPFLSISETDKPRYEASAKLYTQEQCMTILDYLIEAQNQIRFNSSGRLALEAILLHVMRIHQRIPVGFLVRRLAELEQAVSIASEVKGIPDDAETVALPVKPIEKVEPVVIPKSVQQEPIVVQQPKGPVAVQQPKEPMTAQQSKEPMTAQQIVQPPQKWITEDPTPSAAELGIKNKKEKAPAPIVEIKPKVDTAPVEAVVKVKKEAPSSVGSSKPEGIAPHQQSHYDTLLHFAAVELEGTVKKI
ncbi:MAG: DNA polymerase III subunit gamma/tau [Parachlamydiaceae bacterium]